MPANIRLGQKCMTVTNTLAYYKMELMTANISFFVGVRIFQGSLILLVRCGAYLLADTIRCSTQEALALLKNIRPLMTASKSILLVSIFFRVV